MYLDLSCILEKQRAVMPNTDFVQVFYCLLGVVTIFKVIFTALLFIRRLHSILHSLCEFVSPSSWGSLPSQKLAGTWVAPWCECVNQCGSGNTWLVPCDGLASHLGSILLSIFQHNRLPVTPLPWYRYLDLLAQGTENEPA